MPLRFSRRILLLIGPVIAVLLTSSLVSLVALVRLADRMTELTDYQLPLVQRITLLNFNQHEQTLQLQRALNLSPEDIPGEIEALRRGFDRRAEHAHSDLLEALHLAELAKGSTESSLHQEMSRIYAGLADLEGQTDGLQLQINEILDRLAAGDLAEVARRRASIEETAGSIERAVEESLISVEGVVALHSERARVEERRAILATGVLLVMGIAAGALIVFWGVRSLVAAKDRERRFSALAAVGEFSTAVAHGLRNPLAGIRAAAQLAAQEAASSHSTAESLNSIRNEADRLEQRIGSLLELSRPFHPNRRRQDLRQVLENVRETLAEAARQEGVEISARLPSSPVMRRVDGDYLEDALLELTSNALHAMPEGGTISLGLQRSGRGVRLSVEDTGAGIPENVRGRVFDLFFSTRERGSGMGLAGVRKIVEAHGGRISILETGPGGTTFAIDLP